MQVTLFEIPIIGAEVRTFGVMAMLSFVFGIALAIWRARDKDFSPNFIMDLGIVCLLTGMLGARFFFVLQEYDRYNWSLFSVTDGGFSIPGVFLGLAIPFFLYFGWQFLKDLDAAEKTSSPRENEKTEEEDVVPRKMYWLVISSLVLGVLVSRIVYVYSYPEAYYHTNSSPFDFLKIWQGGIVFYGGLFGGIIGGSWFVLSNDQSFIDVADLMAAPLLLAQSIARWGCFFAGDDFGMPASESFSLAVRFPRQSGSFQAAIYGFQRQLGIIERGAEFTTWVHPAQIYMSAGVFICFLLLLFLERWKLFRGWSFGWMIILYSVHRFIVEFFRGDPVPVYTFTPIVDVMKTFQLPKVYAGVHGWVEDPIYGLRISQLISVFLLILGVAFMIWSWSRHRAEG